MPRLLIDIQNPLGILGTYKDTIARTMLGLNRFDTLDVNPDQTVVSWNLFFSSDTSLTGIGSDLTTDMPDPNAAPILTGGFLDGFGYHKPGTGAASADISNFNRDATVVQARIDHVLDLGSTNGWSIEQEATALVDRLFDNRAQKIIGSEGDDLLLQGGSKADIINGNGGNDYIMASPGNDTIHGGAGNDTVDFSALSSFGALTGSIASHTVTIGGAAAINGGGASAQMNGLASVIKLAIFGVDSFNLTDNGDGFSGNRFDNTIDGGAGNDTLSGKGGNDLIIGHAGNDDLFGNGGDDVIFGGDGVDVIHGNAGNDELFGEADADTIYGDAGNDFISGLDGHDQLRGGAGKDTIVGGTGLDFILGGTDDDVLNGEGGDDTIRGQDGNDSIMGDGGMDTLQGGIGRDTILGGDGGDELDGGSGDDLLKGQGGPDTIDGGPGDDRLLGGAGNDYVDGELGNDHLTGGPNADSFIFNTFDVAGKPQGNDVITDLTALDNITIYSHQLANVSIMASGSDAIIDYGFGVITVNETDASMLIAVQAGLGEADVLITLLV